MWSQKWIAVLSRLFQQLIIGEITGKNNRFPILDILEYLKNTHKNLDYEQSPKSQIWQSEASPNQGIPNQVPWLGLAGLSLRAGGRGFSPATYECGPRLLLLENRRKLEPKETPRCLIPRLLFVFIRQLEILATTLDLSHSSKFGIFVGIL